MRLTDAFPELAKELIRDLRRIKRADLAEQVAGLELVDRCRCGSISCGTFYTVENTNVHGPRLDNLMLDCGATVTELRGKIVEVETLDPSIEKILRELLP